MKLPRRMVASANPFSNNFIGVDGVNCSVIWIPSAVDGCDAIIM